MEERDLRALYAYLNGSPETQEAIEKLVNIIEYNGTAEQENEAARLAIIETLFPSVVSEL